MILVVGYFAVLGILAIAGIYRFFLVYLPARRGGVHRKASGGSFSSDGPGPGVTVQLPVYNEKYVIGRLIHAVCGLDYPRDHLEIQVLDDSTDETSQIAAKLVSDYASRGFRIHHVRRADREGFKGGALNHGLKSASGEFVAIFDADFVPPPDALTRMLEGFSEESVGMVQGRWGHLNRDFSALTRAQAAIIDSTLAAGNQARYSSGRFFSFSGSGGMWRRKALEEGGGWQTDTLTEDLDLSYRVQLRGWKFVYLDDLVIPAELPADMSAFRSQQRRWAKGSIQVALKLTPAILASPVRWVVKADALFHLGSYLVYPFLLALGLLLLPAAALGDEIRSTPVRMMELFLITAAILPVVPLTVFRESRDRVGNVSCSLLAPAVAAGMSLGNTLAILEAIVGRRTEFVRTPKLPLEERRDRRNDRRLYHSRSGVLPWFQLVVALYFGFAFFALLAFGEFTVLPPVLLFGVGFFYVGFSSLASEWNGTRSGLLCLGRNMLVSTARQVRSILRREPT